MTKEEQQADIEAAIRRDVPRPLLAELLESVKVAAAQADRAVSQAVDLVPGGIQLSGRRSRRAVGLVRYQITDEFFERLILAHGGELVGSVVVEGGSASDPKNAAVHLTTGRFGRTLIGFASHREREDLPVRNASRIALANQNRGLALDLLARSEPFDARDRFVVVMVRRDAVEVDKIAEVTICVTDPALKFFLVQTRLEEFLASYGAAIVEAEKPAVVLKKVSKPFKSTAADDQAGAKEA